MFKGQYTKISITFLIVGEKLWWADQGTDRIGTCDKKDGGNWKVLRNNTSPVMHMRIYDEDVQKGKTFGNTIWKLARQFKLHSLGIKFQSSCKMCQYCASFRVKSGIF